MRPIDAEAAVAALRRYEDWECPSTGSAISAVQDAIKIIYQMPTLAIDGLLPKERAMWLPYYNGGIDRREYRCSKCWNGTPNNQDPRCLNCGSEMLRGL